MVNCFCWFCGSIVIVVEVCGRGVICFMELGMKERRGWDFNIFVTRFLWYSF